MLKARPVDIGHYKRLVDRCARERLDYVIPNGSPTHARILIAKLFETARNSALLVSGQLIDTTEDEEEVYGFPEVIAAARSFLRRPDSNLTIILEEPVDRLTENRFLLNLIGDSERKGTIVLYPDTRAVKLTGTPHMMVTDALAYRMELDNEDVVAYANFGDGPAARNAMKLFESLRDYVHELKKPVLTYQPGARFALAL